MNVAKQQQKTKLYPIMLEENNTAEVSTMTAEDSKRKNRITKRCLKIIDTLSLEMYDELFETEEDEDV